MPHELPLTDLAREGEGCLTPTGEAEAGMQWIQQYNPSSANLGLSQERYIELLEWLLTIQADCAVICETHWSFTREWQSKDWTCIHTSSGSSKQAGILILVARRLLASDDIGWRVLDPGRLVQVRLHFKSASTDLVRMYQHSYTTAPDRMASRKKLWMTFDALLCDLPNRNDLLIAGDFNSSLDRQIPLVGSARFKWNHAYIRGPLHKDMHEVQSLLQRHSLCLHYLQPGKVKLTTLSVNLPINRVPVGCGVRQGCRVAPILWVSYVQQIFQRLIPLVGLDWLLQNVTIFADDIHIANTFSSLADLQRLLCNIGHVLDVIEGRRLNIQYNKSVVLFAVAGHQAKQVRSKFLQRSGDAVHLTLDRPSGTKSTFLVHNKAVYLGVIVSYHVFEDQCVAHRIRAGRAAFTRLRSWLTSKRMTLRSRLHVWKTCILSIITYGLCTTTLTVKGLASFQQVTFQMIRTVLGNHAFRTRHTHLQILQAFDLPHPLHMLQSVGQRLLQTLTERLTQIQHNDCLHRLDWSHLPEFLRLIDSTFHLHCASQALNPLVPSDRLRPAVCCPWCAFQTDSIANLRRHCTHVHHAPVFRTHAMQIAQYAYKGLPQCSQCFQVFTTWRQFAIHLERQCCMFSGAPSLRTAVGRMADDPAQPGGSASSRPDVLHVARSHPDGPALLTLVANHE
eukprot:s1590_g9.t1